MTSQKTQQNKTAKAPSADVKSPRKIFTWTNALLALAALVLAMFIALATFLTSTCWTQMNQCLISTDSPVLLFAGAVPIVIILALIATTKKFAIDEKLAKKIVIAVLAAVGAVSLFLIMYFSGRITATIDSKAIIDSVKNPTRGPQPYLAIFPFQDGAAMLVRLSFKLFGVDNLSLFYILNAVSVIAIIFAIYRLTLRLTKNSYRVAVVALVLAALFTPLYYYLSLVYGDIMGLALALWAIIVFLSISRKNWLRQAALLAAISVVMIFAKSTFLIVLLALLAAALIVHRGWKVKLSVFAIVLFAIIVAQVANSAFISAYHKKYVAPYEASRMETLPKIAWVAMGLQSGALPTRAYTSKGENVFIDRVATAHKISQRGIAPGMYNGFILTDQAFGNRGLDKKSAKYINKSLVSMAKNPGYAYDFFRYKFAYEWANPSFATFYDKGNSMWTGQIALDKFTPSWARSMYTSDPSIQNYQKLYQLTIYFAAFCAVIFLLVATLRGKVFPADTKVLDTILLVVGCGFGAFTLWEASSRYVMLYFILLIPLAALGLELTGRQLREVFACLQKRARHV